ncbi:MAG TPA: acetamidase/formamidase family protein [Pyrinomonadaceae bacterium]|nr:acetamidase/formamidase family protein [Pyrinomonadaceae bacterium]
MFKNLLSLAMLCLLFAGTAAHAANGGDTPISGQWTLTFTASGESHAVRANFEAQGDQVTGNIYRTKLKGTFQKDRLEIVMANDAGVEQGRLVGVLRDGKFTGSGTLWGLTLDSWTAVRPAAAPAAPQTHNYIAQPTAYQRYLSMAFPAALRVFPGDTVRTTLIDEDGRDASGKAITVGGFPVVGPFFVEHAMPGDLLAVRFNKVRLNRETAESGHELVGPAADPKYVRHAKAAKNFDHNWKINLANNTASLAKPTAALASLAVPVQPMVGIVGVAPPGRQAMASRSVGDNFGGHLDYNEIREGVTVYLPVFHEGARLFLGDGHALQGDGQLSGEGLETSLDVEFTVNVIPQKSFPIPYAENATEMMFIGVGGSIELALQRATTGLAVYLEREYGLNSTESAAVLGVAAQYRIAKVAVSPDEQTTVVAKIPKTVLEQLGKTKQAKTP